MIKKRLRQDEKVLLRTCQNIKIQNENIKARIDSGMSKLVT